MATILLKERSHQKTTTTDEKYTKRKNPDNTTYQHQTLLHNTDIQRLITGQMNVQTTKLLLSTNLHQQPTPS